MDLMNIIVLLRKNYWRINNMKILIAEDEDDIRRLLALNMKKEGYEVIECKDGIETLEAFKNQ